MRPWSSTADVTDEAGSGDHRSRRPRAARWDRRCDPRRGYQQVSDPRKEARSASLPAARALLEDVEERALRVHSASGLLRLVVGLEPLRHDHGCHRRKIRATAQYFSHVDAQSVVPPVAESRRRLA